MRLTRPRFTVRRMMVAVIILALLFWAAHMYRLSVVHQRLATDFAKKEEQSRVDLEFWGGFVKHERMDLETASDAVTLKKYDNMITNIHRELDRNVNLKIKYENASRRPWLSLAPDSPEPE